MLFVPTECIVTSACACNLSRPKLSRPDAYCFLSVAADVRVTQLVNFPTRGAHVVVKKDLLVGLGEDAPPPVPASLLCGKCATL
jgi:hypothetical protein